MFVLHKITTHTHTDTQTHTHTQHTHTHTNTHKTMNILNIFMPFKILKSYKTFETKYSVFFQIYFTFVSICFSATRVCWIVLIFFNLWWVFLFVCMGGCVFMYICVVHISHRTFLAMRHSVRVHETQTVRLAWTSNRNLYFHKNTKQATLLLQNHQIKVST